MGWDVQKKSVAACVRVPGTNGQRMQEVRTFGTTGAELLALRDWLEGHRVTHVAMVAARCGWHVRRVGGERERMEATERERARRGAADLGAPRGTFDSLHQGVGLNYLGLNYSRFGVRYARRIFCETALRRLA